LRITQKQLLKMVKEEVFQLFEQKYLKGLPPKTKESVQKLGPIVKAEALRILSVSAPASIRGSDLIDKVLFATNDELPDYLKGRGGNMAAFMHGPDTGGLGRLDYKSGRYRSPKQLDNSYASRSKISTADGPRPTASGNVYVPMEFIHTNIIKTMEMISKGRIQDSTGAVRNVRDVFKVDINKILVLKAALDTASLIAHEVFHHLDLTKGKPYPTRRECTAAEKANGKTQCFEERPRANALTQHINRKEQGGEDKQLPPYEDVELRKALTYSVESEARKIQVDFLTNVKISLGKGMNTPWVHAAVQFHEYWLHNAILAKGQWKEKYDALAGDKVYRGFDPKKPWR